MRIISRYLLASYLSLFLTVLVASMIVIVIVEMLLNFDDVLEHREGALGIATYLFVRLPSYYLRDLVPVSSFAAAFFCLGLSARAHEVTALKAGGIAPQRAVVAVLVAATALSALALVLNETLVLRASRHWSHLEGEGGSFEISFRRGSFWYHRGDFIYNVRQADPDTRTLRGVSVFELSERGRLLRSIRAERARIEDERHWIFEDATIRHFEPEVPVSPPRVERVREARIEVGTERDLALLDATAATLSLPDLLEYIAIRSREGHDTTRYRAMLHARLAEPLTVLLFALLAVPVGLSVERSRSIAVAALQGIVLLGIFYTVRTVASMFAAGGVAAAPTSPWLLLGAFSGFGAWRFTRVPA